MNASIIGSIWKKMAYPHPFCAPQGERKASEYFNKMMEKGLWIKHGVAVMGFSRYFPEIICECTTKDIYVCEVKTGHCDTTGR